MGPSFRVKYDLGITEHRDEGRGGGQCGARTNGRRRIYERATQSTEPVCVRAGVLLSPVSAIVVAVCVCAEKSAFPFCLVRLEIFQLLVLIAFN